MAEATTIENLNKLYPTNFRFDCARAPYFSHNVQAIQLPSLTLGEATQNTPLIDVPIPGDKIVYGELSVDFIVDEELRGWMEIHNWIRSSGFPDSTDQYNDQVYADGQLTILSNTSNGIVRVSFFDMYPTSLSDVALTMQASTETVIGSASFRFRSYDVVPVSVDVAPYPY